MKLKVTIIGNVHEVGYGLFLLNLADSLLIKGFDARNITIEGKQALVVLVEGEEKAVKDFAELVKAEKPEKAVFEDVRIEKFEGSVRSVESYRSSLMIEQLSKIVQVGLNMRQDLMLEKQDLMLGRQELRGDLRSYLDERLKS